MIKTIYTCIVSIYLLTAASLTAQAQAGSLDLTFGLYGRKTTAIGSGNDGGYSVAIQTDGKMVVAGYSYNGANDDFALVRYNNDGTLDNNFGSVITPIGSSTDVGNSVAIQTDGKIVVAGYSNNGIDNDFALVRYNSDGTLDTTFSSDGKVTTDFGSSDDYSYSVAIQSDGKIVVAGYTYNGADYDFALARYNTDGSLDNTFGSGGKETTAIGSADDGGKSVAIQSDGKIVVAGYSVNSFIAAFALVRYNSDGTLDNTFDSDGKVTTAIGSANDGGYSVAIQTDNKIVVAGYSNNGTDDDFALVRYNSDGSLDNTFSSDGKVTTAIGSADDVGNSVAIRSDGKIVVAGYSNNGAYNDFALVRYNSDGTLDNTFSSDGKVTSDVGSANDVGNSVHLQADGKIVVAGYSNNGFNYDFALARYNSDGTLDNIFGSGGKVTTAIGSAADVGNSVAIQSDGKIVVAGYSYNGTDFDFAIARYNSDGTLDTTFSSDGKVTTDFGSSSEYSNSVAIQSDGKIVLAGNIYNGGYNYFAVVRYNRDGTMDNTFGSGGKVTTAIGSLNDQGNSVAIQTDGKIVVAGSSQATYPDFALVRYNSDGTLDNTFSSDGKVTTDFGTQAYGSSVAIQSNGYIVVAGQAWSGGNVYFALARYTSYGSLDNTFGFNGKVTTAIGSSDDEGYSVAIQTDGKIVVAGYSNNGTDKDFALVRYNSDGTLDNTFSSDGKVTTAIGNDGDAGYSVALQTDGKIVVAGSSFNGADYDFAIARYNSDGSLDNTFDLDGKVTTAIGSVNDYGKSVAIQSDGKIVVAGVSNNDFAVARYNAVCSPINFSQSPIICQGQSVTVGSHIYVTSGNYVDTLTAVNGCDSVVITNLIVNPTFKITVNDTINDGDSIQVGIHIYKASGTYIDTLITINGCDSIVTTHLMVVTGIDPITYQGAKVEIYPNPFSNELLIKGTKEKGVAIIFDAAGKEILRQKTFYPLTKINTEFLIPGFYLLNYKEQNKTVNIKLAKF